MDQGPIPDAASIAGMHDEAIKRWHELPIAGEGSLVVEEVNGSFPEIILAQHRANFELWHQEDEARDTTAPDARIAVVKHAIDALNQRRNDLVEMLDGSLSIRLRQALDSPLHSETPAMIVDRLSIMALKIFHMRQETERESATEEHREKNRKRLVVLIEQRNDLAGCLDALLEGIVRGERHFKVYRQMKMYNDPDLNPVLYRGGGG